MIPPSCFSSYNHFDCPNNLLTSKLTFPTKWNKTKKIEQICYYSSVTQVVHVLLLIFSPLTGPSPTLGSDGACAPAAWGGGDERVCLVFCILLALSSYFKHKRQVGFSLIDPYLSSEDQALSPVDSAHCNCMVPTCASFQLGWSPEAVASRMIFQHYKVVTFDTGAVRCYKHQDNCAIKRRIDGKFNKAINRCYIGVRLGCAFRRIPAGFQQNLAKRHHQEKMWKFKAPECSNTI